MSRCSIFITWSAIIATIEYRQMSPYRMADEMCDYIISYGFVIDAKA